MPSEYMNNDDIDSGENWVLVVLQLIKPEFDDYCSVVSYMVPRVKKLKEEKRISHWHFRYGSYGADVSFRLRSGADNRNEVFNAVEGFAGELKQQRLVESYNMREDQKWVSNDRWKRINETSESRCNWWWQIECDELLSEIAYKVLAHKKPRDMVYDSLHDFLNMFCIQGIGQSYELLPRKLDDWSGVLTGESFAYLQKVFARLKSNYVGTIIEPRKVISKEMIETLKAQYESIFEKDWEKTVFRIILFFHIL